jgi:hypothetical protein
MYQMMSGKVPVPVLTKLLGKVYQILNTGRLLFIKTIETLYITTALNKAQFTEKSRDAVRQQMYRKEGNSYDKSHI